MLSINNLVCIRIFLSNSKCFSLLFAFVLLHSLSVNAQDVYVGGIVSGRPLHNRIEGAKVVVINTSTASRIDSTYTNIAGYYTMNFVWQNIRTNNASKQNTIYPNPSVDVSNIEFYAQNNGQYQLTVRRADGRIVLSGQFETETGINKITLTGGEAGTYTVSVANSLQNHVFTAIRSSNKASTMDYSVSSGDKSGLKTTLSDVILLGDEIKLEFTKDGYFLKDTTFVVQAEQIINQQMQQIPVLFNTTLIPYLEDGTPVTSLIPDFSVTIEWSDGTINNYPVTNNEIQINKEIYTLLIGSLGTAWINNDTTSTNGFRVLNWSIGRRPHQLTNRPNIYQNESGNYLANVLYQTEIPLDSLDQKTIYHYVIRNKAETQPGIEESLSSAFSRGLIVSSGNSESGMFIDLKNYTSADSLDIVQKGFNETTGEPMSPELLTKAMNILMQAIQTRYLPNGDTLLPPHRIYTIDNTSDPRWQAIIARNFENCIRTTYYTGPPANGREWASTYTYNGELRLKNSSARYNDNQTDGVMFAENFSAVTGETEGVGGLTTYIWNVTTSQPSQYAKSISTIPVLLNLGTGQ